jgi:hypothetical protein
MFCALNAFIRRVRKPRVIPMPLIPVCGKRHNVAVTLTEQRVRMIVTGSNKCGSQSEVRQRNKGSNTWFLRGV